MKHLFDVELAEAYGMDVAVFIENLAFWIVKNQANKEHLHDGRYWTYNTLDAFTTIFPYFTKKQIRRIIDKSLSFDLIVKGNYNQIGYDRTIWYSLSDKGHAIFDLCLCPDGPIQMPKRAHQNVQTGTPIPDINTDNKPYIKDKIKAQPKKQVAVVSDPYIDPYVLKPEIVLPDWLPNEVWEEFKQHRKQLKKPMSDLAQKKSIKQLEKMRSEGQDVVEVIEASIANGWQGLFNIKSQGESHGKGNSNFGTGRKEKFDSTQWLLDRAKARARGEDPDAIESHVPVENIQYLWNT